MRAYILSVVSMMSAAAIAPASHAQEDQGEKGPHFYAGASAKALIVSDPWTGQDLVGNSSLFDSSVLGVGGVLAGVSFNKYLAVEGEFHVGLTTEQHDGVFSDDDAEVKLNNAVGGYIVGTLPVSPRFSLFARGGAYRIELDRTVRNVGESDIEGTAGSIGGGFAFHIDTVDVRLSFTHHEFDDIGGANSAGLTVLKRF